MSTTAVVVVLVVLLDVVGACPPQPNGNCYAVNKAKWIEGSYQLSNNLGGFQNQYCGSALNRDWCAVSYMPASQQANFGCASNFPIQVGGAICGDGPGFVNQQGCQMMNTPNGPCYFCCCRGGSCNHPQIFAREASKLTISQSLPPGGGVGPAPYNAYPRNPGYVSIPWYNSARSYSSFSAVILLLVFL